MLRVLLVRGWIIGYGRVFQQHPLTYIYREQGHFSHLATIAIALAANRHNNYNGNVPRGSFQVSEAPRLKTWPPSFHERTKYIAYVYLQFL